MRRVLLTSAVLVTCGLGGAANGAAQNVSGAGQQASEVFTLQQGLATWDLEHQGEGEFIVRLLDAEGNLIEQLARATGPARVSKAVRIPHTGEYLYDISATGPWSIQLRPRSVVEATADPLGEAYLAGREDGDAAARERGAGMWFGAGFLGGATLGPVGTAIAVVLSSRGTEVAAHDTGLRGRDPRYIEGFQRGYRDRLVASRRGAALIGGVAGTTLLTILLIQFMSSEGAGPPGGPPGNGTTI